MLMAITGMILCISLVVKILQLPDSVSKPWAYLAFSVGLTICGWLFYLVDYRLKKSGARVDGTRGYLIAVIKCITARVERRPSVYEKRAWTEYYKQYSMPFPVPAVAHWDSFVCPVCSKSVSIRTKSRSYILAKAVLYAGLAYWYVTASPSYWSCKERPGEVDGVILVVSVLILAGIFMKALDYLLFLLDPGRVELAFKENDHKLVSDHHEWFKHVP